MTLAAMWNDYRNVYCIADTAISRPAEGHSGPTSLGQYGDFGTEIVEEAVLKVFHGPKRTLLSGAGNGHAINNFYRYFRENVLRGQEPSVAAGTAGDLLLRASDELPRCRILVGYWSEHGHPVRFVWEPENPNVLRGTGAANILGKGPSWLHSALYNALKQRQHRPMPGIAQVEALAYLVKSAMAEPGLLESGVGGPMVGCSVNQEGVSWQPDTMYVMVTDEFFDSLGDSESVRAPDWMVDIVCVGVRDDVLVSFSTIVSRHQGRPCFRFFQNASTPSIDNWLDYWQASLLDIVTKPRQMVFLHKLRNRIVIFRGTDSVRSPIRVAFPEVGLFFNRQVAQYLRERLCEQTPDGVEIELKDIR